MPGVADGSLAGAQRAGGRAARALAQPLLLVRRRQPAAAAAQARQQRHVSHTHPDYDLAELFYCTDVIFKEFPLCAFLYQSRSKPI